MSDFCVNSLYITMLAIEFLVFIIFSGSFFQFSKTIVKTIAGSIAAFLVNYWLLFALQQYSSMKLLVGCTAFALLSKYLYAISITRSFFVAITYLALINLTDNLFLFFVSALTYQNIDQLMSDPYVYFFLGFSAKIVEVLLVALIHMWGKRRFYSRSSFPQNYVKLSIFPIASLVCTVTLLNAFFLYPQAAPQLLLCTMVLLIADISIILLLNQFEMQQQAIIDNRLLERELKLAHDNMEALAASYASQRKLTHDFQNELAVLQGLLQQDQIGSEAKATNYINQLLKQEYTPILAISTHRIVVDVLLNQKYTIAAQKEIKFRIQLNDLSKFPLPDDAMVVVLSNLLDNALDACEQIDDPDNRFISVKAQTSADDSILYIENSVSKPVKISDGHIATTKKDVPLHGYGLQNVIAVINSFGGTYAMQCEDLIFSFVIAFHQ